MKRIIILTLVALTLFHAMPALASITFSAADSLLIKSTLAEIEIEERIGKVMRQDRLKENRQNFVRKILLNVGKAVGIVVILLVGRWIIGLIGRKVGDEKTYDNVSDAESLTMIFVGTSSQEEAAGIARSLVEERLAACANILDGTSIRSPGRETVAHTLMVVKTARRKIKSTVKRIKELHQNPTPEIIPYPIGHGLKSYIAWVRESTNSNQWWHRV